MHLIVAHRWCHRMLKVKTFSFLQSMNLHFDSHSDIPLNCSFHYFFRITESVKSGKLVNTSEEIIEYLHN